MVYLIKQQNNHKSKFSNPEAFFYYWVTNIQQNSVVLRRSSFFEVSYNTSCAQQGVAVAFTDS